MCIGYCMLELHLSEARSLKEKRMVLNRLKQRLQGRYNVAVAEVDHQDLWQRASIAVVSVASSREPVERLLRTVEQEVEREFPGELLRASNEFFP